MTFSTDEGSPLHVAVHRDGDRTTVTVTGELDLLSGPLLARLLNTAMGDDTKHLDVAASQLDFVDVAGVRALLTAYQLAADRGVELKLCDPTPYLAWLLRTVDGDGVLLSDNASADGVKPYPDGSSPSVGAGESVDDVSSAASATVRADERDEHADDRDRLAQERDRLADERAERVREHQRWEDLREDLADARERDLERREQGEQEQ